MPFGFHPFPQSVVFTSSVRASNAVTSPLARCPASDVPLSETPDRSFGRARAVLSFQLDIFRRRKKRRNQTDSPLLSTPDTKLSISGVCAVRSGVMSAFKIGLTFVRSCCGGVLSQQTQSKILDARSFEKGEITCLAIDACLCHGREPRPSHLLMFEEHELVLGPLML